MDPDVEIIGVYAVPDCPDVHLLEVSVNAPAAAFDVADFTQDDPAQPQENWQVAYDEHYLNLTGDAVLGHDAKEVPRGHERTRVAFFLHLIDFTRPLLTPCGPKPLPAPIAMPARLGTVVIYDSPA